MYCLDVYEPATETKVISSQGSLVIIALDFDLKAEDVVAYMNHYKKNRVTLTFRVETRSDVDHGRYVTNRVMAKVTRIDWLDDKGHTIDSLFIPGRF